MTWGRVLSRNSDRMLTMTTMPHRAKRKDIASIDIARSDFGKVPQVVPIVRLKHGKAFKLSPLCVSGAGIFAPQSSETHARR